MNTLNHTDLTSDNHASFLGSNPEIWLPAYKVKLTKLCAAELISEHNKLKAEMAACTACHSEYYLKITEVEKQFKQLTKTSIYMHNAQNYQEHIGML